MKIPTGTPGIQIATSKGRCNDCGNSIRPGDRVLNPFRGIYLCIECWPDDVVEELEKNRPTLCPDCNLYHRGDCW